MNVSSTSLFLPRELFAPQPVLPIEPEDDPFLAPFDVQHLPTRVDLYLPLLASQHGAGAVACS
ncbi:MAG TPA: hypothetical protein VJN68_16100 [Burkholderiaceae bacterium]|nr:hypothetical protein [Burkholderiaceae bacterium]